MDSKSDYNKKQRGIVRQLKLINNIKGVDGLGLSKQNSNLFRNRKKGAKPKLDVRSLNKVIHVDKKKLIAEVEGMTTYQDLVDATLAFSLLPPVVPQLATITIGGAISGGGIEASSFKFGLVHETVEEMTILLSNGEVITATAKNKHRDIFAGIVNSYGTLGYILKLKVKLVKASPFVQLRHFSFTNSKDYFAAVDEVFKYKKYKGERVDFMDGMVIDSKKLYLLLARFTEKAPYLSNYKYMNIYFRSIAKRSEDFLTVRDFIWRWDTDWFWCSKGFGLQNPLLRLIVGKFLLNSKAYWKITKLDGRFGLVEKWESLKGKNKSRERIVQDVEIPIDNSGKFLDFFIKRIGISPIWICPLKTYKSSTNFPFFPFDPKKEYINFGFWDSVPANKNSQSYFNRLIERTVIDLKGHKSLYSDSFHTESQFWNIYDKKLYNKLKSIYDPDSRLKNLYQKCVTAI